MPEPAVGEVLGFQWQQPTARHCAWLKPRPWHARSPFWPESTSSSGPGSGLGDGDGLGDGEGLGEGDGEGDCVKQNVPALGLTAPAGLTGHPVLARYHPAPSGT